MRKGWMIMLAGLTVVVIGYGCNSTKDDAKTTGCKAKTEAKAACPMAAAKADAKAACPMAAAKADAKAACPKAGAKVAAPAGCCGGAAAPAAATVAPAVKK